MSSWESSTPLIILSNSSNLKTRSNIQIKQNNSPGIQIAYPHNTLPQRWNVMLTISDKPFENI